MKKRWFLRGMGVGIVLTVLILCVTYRSIPKNNNVIKQARELGMVFPEIETDDISAAPRQTAEKAVKKNNAVAVSAPAVQEKGKSDKAAQEKMEKGEKDISSVSRYKDKKTTFVVKGGLVSNSVAKEMKEAGIVDDAGAFNRYLEKNGYGKIIRSGKYEIPKGADYETIAKIITRQE